MSTSLHEHDFSLWAFQSFLDSQRLVISTFLHQHDLFSWAFSSFKDSRKLVMSTSLHTESTNLAVHTSITSRLDYYNSLLADINRGLLKRLQNAQGVGNVLPIFDFFIRFFIGLRWILQIRLFKFWKLEMLCIKNVKTQNPSRCSLAPHLKWRYFHI